MVFKLNSYLVLALLLVFSTVIIWFSVGMKTVYENFDGPYYLVVSKCWYEKQCIGSTFSFPLPLEYYPAHLPGYPAFIALFDVVTNNSLVSMVSVNVVFSLLGAMLVYHISRQHKWGDPFWLSISWMFLWPRMWAVRSVGSPETMFVVFCLASLYLFTRKRFVLSGVVAALAVLTKSPGIILVATYAIYWGIQSIKTRRITGNVWPMLIPLVAVFMLFSFYQKQTGDFFAYFNSGDNIHLFLAPFQIFDNRNSWVGTFWLEEVIWIYIISGIGVYYALKKNMVFGLFGGVFLLSIFFVSHRDISRYSLPLVPIVLIGLADLLKKREIKIALALSIIPMFYYTINFVANNTVGIPSLAPFI